MHYITFEKFENAMCDLVRVNMKWNNGGFAHALGDIIEFILYPEMFHALVRAEFFEVDWVLHRRVAHFGGGGRLRLRVLYPTLLLSLSFV